MLPDGVKLFMNGSGVTGYYSLPGRLGRYKVGEGPLARETMPYVTK
jgi:hypothetical protein